MKAKLRYIIFLIGGNSVSFPFGSCLRYLRKIETNVYIFAYKYKNMQYKNVSFC